MVKDLNRVESVALLSADHSVVCLDAGEDDMRGARGAVAEVSKLQELLSSDVAMAMDDTMKKSMRDYLDVKLRTISQKHVMDAINITSNSVANDVVQRIHLDQQRAEVSHLLKSVIDTSPPSLSTQPPLTFSQCPVLPSVGHLRYPGEENKDVVEEATGRAVTV